MRPRFKCAFCNEEVRRATDKSSVGMDGRIYFKAADQTIDIALEFCSLKCLVSYIIMRHVWKCATGGNVD